MGQSFPLTFRFFRGVGIPPTREMLDHLGPHSEAKLWFAAKTRCSGHTGARKRRRCALLMVENRWWMDVYSASHMASSLPVDKFIGNLSHHVVRSTFGIARWVANLGITGCLTKFSQTCKCWKHRKIFPLFPVFPRSIGICWKRLPGPSNLPCFSVKSWRFVLAKKQTTMKLSFPKTRVKSPMLPG